MTDYANGSLVWVKHDKLDWCDAVVISSSATDVDVTTVFDQETITVKKHPDVCRPMDELSLIGVDDMTALPELFEGSLLRNLSIRHKVNNIYTYTGTILVAVNPYKTVPLYGKEMVLKYSNSKIGSLPPHIFALADDAYRRIDSDKPRKSILISGESGAGKTESTKLIVNYLTFQSGEHSPVEQLLMESSPILEAFGNATTSMNNNSSRFGKYVEVFFSNTGKIVGGKVTEYLLEKSRIVKQPALDRNYHVFYALIQGANAEDKAMLKLTSPKDFHYLRNGNTKNVPGIDDQKAFKELRFALSVVGFSPDQQLDLFRIISFVLHLGNITVARDPNDQEKSVIPITDAIKFVASLVQVNEAKLIKCITSQSFKTGKDTIARESTPAQAEATRDSIAKTTYGCLFHHIVAAINNAMALKKSKLEEVEEEEDEPANSDDDLPSVGILDIFGFEVMEVNSFEQFCINLANETLQMYFNTHIFKMEQEEYRQEEITWTAIAYTDNEDCLKTLYRGKLSLLNLLDEESYFPSATDDSLIAKFNENHNTNSIFGKAQGKTRTFSITHYAAKVTYNVTGFLEKNMDSLNDFVIDLFLDSKIDILRGWFETLNDLNNVRSTIKRGAKPSTVGGKFKDSLTALMTRLEQTDPYFIRCIKPNKDKAPGAFDRELVLSQLRYTGMIETVKIRSLGYALRMAYDEFYNRYFPVKIQHGSTETKRRRSEIIINHLNLDPKEYQLGKTMVFMRNGPKRILEAKRFEIIAKSAQRLSEFTKMVLARKSFLNYRAAAITFQKLYRGKRDRASYKSARIAAIKIQKVFRGFRARKAYRGFTHSLPLICAALRARICRSALVARKAIFDHMKDEEMKEKERIKQEELQEEKRRKEAEEQVKLVEARRREALLENPGFNIIGLAQELNNEEYDQITLYDLPPPAAFTTSESSNAIVDVAVHYSFAKYASLYLRPDTSITYSEEPFSAGMLVKLTPAEDISAGNVATAIKSFVNACDYEEIDGHLRFIVDAKKQDTRKSQMAMIWETCRSSIRLTDELFCQLVKHTTMNGSKASVLAGWYLLALCVGCMLPSETLFPYLLTYVVQRGPEGYASHCQRMLLRIKQNGARKRAPASIEHPAAYLRAAINVDVYPGPQPFALDAVVLGEELTHVLAPAHRLPIAEGFMITVNERIVLPRAHVLDQVSMLEDQGVTYSIRFRRQFWLPTHQRDYDPINTFVANQIFDDIVSNAFTVSDDDSLRIAVLWYIANDGTKEKIKSLNFDAKLANCAIAPHLAAKKGSDAWISEFTKQYERQALSASDAKKNMITIAETWDLYFGHSYPARYTTGAATFNSNDQLFLFINLNGIHVYKYEASKRIELLLIDYTMLTDLAATATNVNFVLIGNKTYGFDTLGSEVKEVAMIYMRHLKEKAVYCISTQPHDVRDPLLLEFFTGSIIRIVPTDDAPEGWLKGECNDNVGLFPQSHVDGLLGAEPPTSKEAILFQVALGYEEESVRSELMSALSKRHKSASQYKLNRTVSMQFDERYNFLEFAKKYFNPPKRSKNTTRNILPGSPKEKVRTSISGKTGQRFGSLRFPNKNQPVSTLVGGGEPEGGFTVEDLSFSNEPLKQPLLALVASKRNVKLAVSLSQGILRCMGDYPSKRDWREHAVAIIEEGIETEELRDELLCQIMKQLINNQRRESIEKGWWLLNLCLGCFTPSERLYPYLKQFLVFTGTSSQTAQTFQNKLPIALRVFFPDHSSRSFMLDAATTAKELLMKISKKLDPNPEIWAGCGLYISSESFEMSIPTKVHVFDAMAEAGISPSNCKLVFKKKLWLGKEDTSSDVLNNLLYHQVLPVFLKGLLRCPVEDNTEKLQEIAFLAALQYKATGDDQGKNRDFIELFRGYIPEYLYQSKTKEEWTQVILSAYSSLLSNKSQADAKSVFIDCVRKWPLFGSSFFHVKQSFEPSIPESLIMAVNVKGIFILNAETKETLLLFKIGEIASWYFGAKHFSLKVHDLQSGDKFIFYTSSGEEITDLLEDYIQALIEQKKKGKPTNEK